MIVAELVQTTQEVAQSHGNGWLWWLIVVGVAIAALIWLYVAGTRLDKKQAQVFSNRISGDLFNILKKVVDMSEGQLQKAIADMWNRDAAVDFGNAVERIEYETAKVDSATTKCIVSVVVADGDGYDRISAERTYSWDNLPTDISKMLIASGDKKDVRILYTKKQRKDKS